MDEQKDLSVSNEEVLDNSDSSVNDEVPNVEENADTSNVNDDRKSAGNGYRGLASSNREAFSRGLSDNYNERIARNQANLNAFRANAANSKKEVETDNGVEEKDKTGLEKVKDKADVLRNKGELAASKIDKARAGMYAVTNPKEAAKMAIKAKIRTWILASIVPITIGCLSLFVLFVGVLFVLGLFEFESQASGGSIAISSTYTECNSVNVNGELYSLDDYVAGVVSHEAYLSEGEEALKAQAIAARTYVLHWTNGCTKVMGNSQASQTFNPNFNDVAKKAAYDTAGMVLTYNGEIFSAMYDSYCYADGDCPDSVKNSDGTYSVTYTKLPNKEQHKITLSDSLQYGRIVPGGGHANGMSQLVSYQMAKEGKNYKEILGYFYSDGVQISLLTTNSNGGGVVGDDSGKYFTGSYTDNSTGKTYYNYKQILYENSWISNYGCGLTSAAIIINSDNRNVTPQFLYDNYNPEENVYIPKYFDDYNFKYKRYLESNSVSKMEDSIISNFNNGGTAIFKVTEGCNINGTSWTNSQHYFAVLDYDQSNDKVYVSNPGSTRDNKNGWISLDSFSCATVAYLVEPK